MSLPNLLSPEHLVSTYGLAGIFLIVFAETGLFVGFFLPGDSLLFLAGAYAASSGHGVPHLPLGPLLIGLSLAAIVGAQTGYYIGQFLGNKFLDATDHPIIKPKYIKRTREVLEQYGEFKAVVLSRVIPIVRTFINPVVGALGMNPRKFLLANIIGGLIWALGVTMLGYGLGASIDIDKYILPLTGVIILISVIPVVIEIRKQHKKLSAD